MVNVDRVRRYTTVMHCLELFSSYYTAGEISFYINYNGDDDNKPNNQIGAHSKACARSVYEIKQ